MAELFGSDDLIQRLTGMVESLESKGEAEQARAEAEQARAEAAIAGLRSAILAAWVARFGGESDELHRALHACDDPAVLQSALLAAVTATDPAAPLAALGAAR